jgi:hypothetical protein
MAEVRTCFDGHERRSSNSRCIGDQNDSIAALSWLEATRPIDPSSSASRSRCPNSQLVY